MRQLTERQRGHLSNTDTHEFTGTTGAEGTGGDEGARNQTLP